MLRISKLTDYGTVILAQMARDPARTYSATSLAQAIDLPLGTVSKLLKLLSRSGLLSSYRGKQGGYRLAKPPQQISLARVIEVLEGPVAVTECSQRSGLCKLEARCAIRRQWQGVNGVIYQALQSLSLDTLLKTPGSSELIGVKI